MGLWAGALALSASGCGGQVAAGGFGADSWWRGAVVATPLGLDVVVPTPVGNPTTAEKVELGLRLFFDGLLSRDGSVACASCHRPERAFTDERRFSPGVDGRTTNRNAPTLVNRGYGWAFFWDGRARSLEEAVLMPIRHPSELDLTFPELLRRLGSDPGYVALFASAFPGEAMTEELVARALSAYLRTILSGDAPIDRFAAGDTMAISAAARRGRRLFLGSAGCGTCHPGPTFTDERFHNTGVSWGSGDLGRFVVTGAASDRGRFKTPTLRNVTRTAPYMHDGSKATLEEIIEFYSRVEGANPNLDPSIRRFTLTGQEKSDLLEFLGTLNSPF
jgi:cytochrome c peroxidase